VTDWSTDVKPEVVDRNVPFPPDRLSLTPAAKVTLQEAGRPMRRGRHITPQQVLDRKPPDSAAALLAAMAVDTAVVRGLGTSPPQP
jgi:hypothetical protein